ncbi:head-tail connector protein [Paenibacillus oenotherae]|uniref:Head-tail connector protein n=1 Tax=Paenibacillus oenotherae TaxID=1435645 RepID=A0ABS7D7Y1_9BACL|nr:head-tail connector protein [Paenibacillus oenotherae]MBW7475946.1 head-tail connector protein [Paenibacillus oenotherae]
MPILTLDETKTWLRIDGEDDDTSIYMLMGAAETYLHNATEVTFDSSNDLAKLYCLVLTADWYENRELIGSQPSDKVRYTCQSIMAQLQHAYVPPPEGETA